MTIHAHGALRGCIGHIADDRFLGDVIRDMTVAAARDDPRFAPVMPEELPGLMLEISVLRRPAPLVPAPASAAAPPTLPAPPAPPAPVDPSGIVVGRDGLIVRRGQRIGLLLPQVATEYHWGPEAFLAATCRKAGLPPDAWREPDTEVLAFQADVFGESG